MTPEELKEKLGEMINNAYQRGMEDAIDIIIEGMKAAGLEYLTLDALETIAARILKRGDK